jgi:steroid delta-isomerase-like uncharacterized protein
MTGQSVREEILRRSADAWNGKDADAYAALYVADGVVYDPFNPLGIRGQAAIAQNVRDLVTAFPDLEFTQDSLLVQGDMFATEVVLRGTHSGPLAGPAGVVPPTGQRMELRGAAVGRFDAQDRIVEERRYFDSMTMLRQLGLLPES